MFHRVCLHLQEFPQLDLFANRRNRQTNRYCSWREDPKSQGNAWQLDWGAWGTVWLNPPWELVGRALTKVQRDEARALFCLPVWKSAIWWPLLQQMLVGTPVTVKGRPLYRNPDGEHLGSPRWATLFGVIQGRQESR